MEVYYVYRKKRINHYKNQNRISSPRLITPFMNKQEYFNISQKEEAAACIRVRFVSKFEDYSSLLLGHVHQGHKDNTVVPNVCTTLTAQFMVDDYDKAQDYHLYVHDILCPMLIVIDDAIVSYIEPDDTYHRIDITHLVTSGRHELKIMAYQKCNDATYPSANILLDDIYIVTRAYDRIEDFDIYCQYDSETGLLQPTLNIKDIEGAPQITYSVLDQFGDTLVTDEVNIDQSNRLNLNAITLDDSTIHHLTLMLETQDEVIMHELMMKFVMPTIEAQHPTKVFTM
ncbi:beta-galactosidase [Staphylococcus agnetis]|nr:beta-galactosidase [Staphylococcus agnetis]PTH48612.1 hypothetical protein BU587_02340 [Staphylococcus agnetis]PTH72073.1 hypothetical protein BU580_09950 [Staphylococcus agnetis]PTH73315.1 hypothetical protein BU581_04860 [Staphylococcus agnetis]